MAFTYFFRDKETLDLIAAHVIPDLKTRRYLTVWDAGCANGPEPYSLAITFRENMGHFLYRNVRIYATDVDESGRFGEIIDRGVFGESEVKRVQSDILSRYFELQPGGNFKVCDELRASVYFQRHDLLSFQPVREEMGLVLCKNVLLHFTPEERVLVIRMFYRALSENGYLVMEPTQKLPPETLSMFQQVTSAGQIFRKFQPADSIEQCKLS